MNGYMRNADDWFLEAIVQCLTPEFARRIVELRADESLQSRVDYLADHANEGLLTPPEDDEYQALIKAADRIGILQAKARRLLSNVSS